MYVGRIVAVGKTPAGKNVAMYRVSSRSFPNREARMIGDAVAIMPKEGFEDDIKKNPYIAYNCVRLANDHAIATNGSHTDPITEKIAMGMPVRDALASSLLAMDYEKDDYNTPRIAAVVPREGDTGYLGIVRHDALMVRAFELKAGQAFYIATYEHNYPCDKFADADFSAVTAADICEHVMRGGAFADLEKPVTAASAVAVDSGFDIATLG